mgnify:FL=1
MSQVKLESPFQSFRGKVCKHSNIIYKEMYGTRFTSQICNPYTGAPSTAQVAQQNKIKTAANAVKALTPEQRAAYLSQFKAQKKYRSFSGFLMAQELAKLS